MEKGAPPPYSNVPPSSNPNYSQTPYPPTQAPPPQTGYPPQQAGYPPQQPEFQQPYPPQGYQQPYQPPQAQVQQPYPQLVPTQVQPQVQKTVTVVTTFGSFPQRINCVNCRTEQLTRTRKRVGALNWIVCGITAIVLLILGSIFLFPIFFLPFALIALCLPGLMDTEHICPNCNHLNGMHRSA